jgi:hypothetical protein
MRATLQGLVNEFVAALGYDRTPNYRPLTVSAPYYPYDDPEGKLPYPHRCYVFTSGDGKALDVGKASRYMGNRIWSHIGRRQRPGEVDMYPDANGTVSRIGFCARMAR